MMKPTAGRIALLVALIVLECCLLFAAFSGSHIDKPGSASAWFEWRKHPSPETEAAWLAEKRTLRREQIMVEVVIWSLIIGTGAGIYYVAKRQRRQI
jgi:hypothetical protein